MILESMKCLLGNRKQFHFGWKLRGQEIEYQKGIKVFQKNLNLILYKQIQNSNFQAGPYFSKRTDYT